MAANTPAIELHIRHMPGGKFTDHVFGAMKEKEILRAEGPFGSFFLREDSDKPMVFLASGTGFAPIKALLEHMQHKVMTRPVSLYWGGRRPEDLYMDAWLKELSTSMPNLSYVPVISDALPEDHWIGRTGYVHQAVLDDFADLSGHEVYACGALSWWTPHAAATPASAACLRNASLPMPSPAKLISKNSHPPEINKAKVVAFFMCPCKAARKHLLSFPHAPLQYCFALDRTKIVQIHQSSNEDSIESKNTSIKIQNKEGLNACAQESCTMSYMNRRNILLSSVALAAAMVSPMALAEQPIHLIVPYAPGGPLDVTARMLAERVRPTLGTVIVENKPGAGGNIGVDAIAKSSLMARPLVWLLSPPMPSTPGCTRNCLLTLPRTSSASPRW